MIVDAGLWLLAAGLWSLAYGLWLMATTKKILLQTKFMNPQKFRIRIANIYLVTNKPKARD